MDSDKISPRHLGGAGDLDLGLGSMQDSYKLISEECIMPRRQIIFSQGSYYHIFNRGVGRERIFRNEENYRYLLRLIGEQTKTFLISVIVYCLMPNHYHFLFRQDGDRPISEFLQAVFNTYVKAFNKRFNRTGALLEDRFKAVRVESEEYLVHLCRYIHRNPIDANPPLVKVLEDWSYSNYPDFIGAREGKLIDQEFTKEMFTNGELYKTFVLDSPSLKVLQRMEKMLLD